MAGGIETQDNCMFEKISFPKSEHKSIKNRLNTLGYCYTTRVSEEVGKYKVGGLYVAPWGDVLKIDEVRKYRKVRERPFYDEMSEDEKTKIRKYSEDIGLPFEFIKFSKATNEELLKAINRLTDLTLKLAKKLIEK